jgi:hypothetical protein
MDIFVIVITALLILVGLVGIVVPLLPGTGLIFAGILLYALYFGIATVGQGTLITLGLATVASILLDYLTGAYGAKFFGASRYGIAGALLGAFFGMLILSLPGLILGLFLGVFLGETLMAKKGTEEAIKVGLGSLVGFFGGTLIKLILGLTMIGVFLAKVLA